MATKEGNGEERKLNRRELPRINLRPLLFCAIGLVFGVFLYLRIRLGGLKGYDFLLPLVLVLAALRPFDRKRLLIVALCIVVFAGLGASLAHLHTERFLSGKPEGAYEVTGTVRSFTVEEERATVILGNISLDGEKVGGKMYVWVSSEEVRAGDIVRFVSKVNRVPLGRDSYLEYELANDIRYTANAGQFVDMGYSKNGFLRLNASIYDVLHDNMDGTRADVSYALLTGNSGTVDEGLMTAMRQGGIAHIFAVSGLHIGILYSVVQVLCKRLRKYSFLPALAVAICYAGLCGFTVSSVRAVIMCGAVGIWYALGRKTDFLNSISVAALIVLAISPAQWLTAGFRLSFGACVGLALFAGSLSRAFKRIRLPSFLGKYLAANLSVQFFTLPILLECFGYASVWGIALNLVLVPVLPVIFLGLLLCTFLALIIPPAAGFFLLFPEGSVSLLVLIFALVDFSFVLTGFSLGAGGALWMTGAVGLSERLRLPKTARAVSAAAMGVLFSVVMVLQNVVFSGCKITVYTRGSGSAALVQTRACNVLIIDDRITLSSCEDFLARTYGGTLDAVCVLSDDARAVNVAAFLGAKEVRVAQSVETGLRDTNLIFEETFALEGLVFRFETSTKLSLVAEGVIVEFDFADSAGLGADLFIESGSGGLIFYLNHGIIKSV